VLAGLGSGDFAEVVDLDVGGGDGAVERGHGEAGEGGACPEHPVACPHGPPEHHRAWRRELFV
jgi:hypothetical protein